MQDERPSSGAASTSIRRLLLGPPLRARDVSKEQINPVEGLSALSLDALTSVAYGPEAIIVVLAAAGASALGMVLPITLAIVGLLVILVFSYRQVIDAYPGGGGAYAVSRANLGANASLVAGAALVVDYTLTVAVSIAAGVGSLTSAFPSLTSATVPMCLAILAVVTAFNLRGLGEAARAFLLPTVVFIVGLLAVIVIGLVHPLALDVPQPGHSLVPTHNLEAIGVLLVLKAFSAGCSALTGVEAIANGVPLFKQPRVKLAKRTEALLGFILGAMLLGLAILARRWHVGPRSGQTVLSQIMAYAVGRHWAYYVLSLTITLVLALAANTSFGGLPVLASLLARDHYLPHLFSLRDDRQVFGNGIWVLSGLSAILMVAVNGDTNRLIPLFAIGVFTGFTLSQTGLVVHWRRERQPHWRRRATVNGTGAVVTAIATIVFLATKFTEGAWVVVVAVPLFIFMFKRVHAYYDRAAKALEIGQVPDRPAAKPTIVVVPVTGVSRLAEQAISEALGISKQVVAVSVVLEDAGAATGDEGGGSTGDPNAGARDAGDPGAGSTEAARVRALEQDWIRWGPGVPLRLLRTEYASVVSPIVKFIDDLRQRKEEQIMVLVPVAVPERVRYLFLHNHVDVVLDRALRGRTDVVIARVQVPLHATPDDQPADDQPADDQPADDQPADDQAGHDEAGRDEAGRDEDGHDEAGHHQAVNDQAAAQRGESKAGADVIESEIEVSGGPGANPADGSGDRQGDEHDDLG
ncbi:MAG TPA: amino acid permease [Acidimicrobiales bacterium]|nr:amino acid permease [Acidimicrobiales bacterium]